MKELSILLVAIAVIIVITIFRQKKQITYLPKDSLWRANLIDKMKYECIYAGICLFFAMIVYML